MTKKPRQLERILLRHGWKRVGQRGSHRHYRHPTIPGTVTIPFHKGKDISAGLEHRILQDAHIGAKRQKGRLKW